MDEFNKIISNLVLLESMDRLQYLLDLAKKNDSIPKELKLIIPEYGDAFQNHI